MYVVQFLLMTSGRHERGLKQCAGWIWESRNTHLVKVLAVTQQTLHFGPRLVAVAIHRHKLLHLLELVHAEDAQRVAPVRPRLLVGPGG